MKKIALLISFIVLITPIVSLAVDLSLSAQSSPGTTNSDWCAIALMVSETDFDKSTYIQSLKDYVTEKYTDSNKLSRNKATEWHRISIAANLAGEDITDFNGINLLNDGVYYRENLGRQGLNGYIWALITISSGIFTEPEDAVNTKDSIISAILEKQNIDGGFPLSGNISNCDITAMAIYALSFYRDRLDVKNAIDNAIIYLSDIQNEDGSFSDNVTPNAESTAQVIIALDAVGIDINDMRFSGIYDALMSFEVEGGFSHVHGGKADTMATYQVTCAKAALGKSEPLYFNGVEDRAKTAPPAEIMTEERTEAPTSEPTESEPETKAEIVTDSATDSFTEHPKDQDSSNHVLITCFAVLLCVTIVLIASVRRKR